MGESRKRGRRGEAGGQGPAKGAEARPGRRRDSGPGQRQDSGPAQGQGQGPARRREPAQRRGAGQGQSAEQRQGNGQGQGPERPQGKAQGGGTGQGRAPERSQGKAQGQGAGPARGEGRGARRRTGPGTTQEAPRASLYEAVTARIVAELEAGRLPWVQPWGEAGLGPSLPRNALSARPYSGINVLILWGAVIEHGWPSQSWLTFRQALEAGGCVRKGERGTTVVYADRFVPRDRKAEALRSASSDPAGEGARAPGEEARAVPFLKRFTVFNIAQCDGLREGLAADPAPLPEREIVPVAEAVIAASGVDFRIGGDRAFYSPALDYVQVPPQSCFFEQVNYYRTCLHELTHATGHPKRLGRDLSHRFGSKGYAREELVAEMGSAFLCAALGIVPTVRHADYLASWLEVLQGDLSDDRGVRGTRAPRGHAIFRAASQASKAADWLLARHREAVAAAQGLAA